MAGGTTEVHTDSEPLITGTHKGASDPVLTDTDYSNLRSFGVIPGQYIENATTGAYGNVESVNGNSVTVAWITLPSAIEGGDITMGGSTLTFGTNDIYFNTVGAGSLWWSPGDVYNIYKTSTKGSVISTTWVDLSRGVKVDVTITLQDGWHPDDIDLDRNNPGTVFGPGQPSSNKGY